MGDKLPNGSGPVFDDQGNQTGTWTSNDGGETFKYDDNPQGQGGDDKDWDWKQIGGKYLSPPGSTEPTASAQVTFTCLVNTPEGCIKWKWKESDRGGPDSPWPGVVTEGTCELEQ